MLETWIGEHRWLEERRSVSETRGMESGLESRLCFSLQPSAFKGYRRATTVGIVVEGSRSRARSRGLEVVGSRSRARSRLRFVSDSEFNTHSYILSTLLLLRK
ncbi:hypothetical protein CDL15_Pgr023242 [Punica granatum]|uniref:Uncharacterized protein n=1 Tax=Punica granatum TaxID=22663 RepID=A0A218X594_PUNGR|nr:hypothetical protein CDL15_Pgr023242 [Punica granatum]PKI57983.1 hypothetical protein CRG98_021634 [Punica granatum]